MKNNLKYVRERADIPRVDIRGVQEKELEIASLNDARRLKICRYYGDPLDLDGIIYLIGVWVF